MLWNFRKHGIEAKVVQRFDLDSELIDWADVVFTAGGDGTFLLAANKVRSHDKPVIGLNTDPSG
jgi:NAD+ kinase